MKDVQPIVRENKLLFVVSLQRATYIHYIYISSCLTILAPHSHIVFILFGRFAPWNTRDWWTQMEVQMQSWTTCNLDTCLLKQHRDDIWWPCAACPPISSLWRTTHAKTNACYAFWLSCDVMLLCLLLNCACGCCMAHVRRQNQAHKNGHGWNVSLVQKRVHLRKGHSGKCNPSEILNAVAHRACCVNQLKLYTLRTVTA